MRQNDDGYAKQTVAADKAILAAIINRKPMRDTLERFRGKVSRVDLRQILGKRRRYARRVTVQVERWLIEGRTDDWIVGRMKKRYALNSDLCRPMIRYTQDRIIRGLNKDRLYWAAESIAFYKTILSDPDAKPLVRLKARERIDKILGLDAPKKFILEDDGEIEGKKLTDAQREKCLQRILQRAQEMQMDVIEGTVVSDDSEPEG